MSLKSVIDRNYKHIRPLRPLYGWVVDAIRQKKSEARRAVATERGLEGAKLDICGGRNPYRPSEFLNVDCVDFPGVDLVMDITKPFPIENGVIAEILSAATLEHFRFHDVEHILQEFHRILQPGGILRVSTPDIEAISKALLEGKEDRDFLRNHFFGKFKSQETEIFDLHKWMAPASEMMEILRTMGFTDIEQIPMDLGLHDPRYNYLIRAVKPNHPSRRPTCHPEGSAKQNVSKDDMLVPQDDNLNQPS